MALVIRSFVIEDSPLQQKKCQDLLKRIFHDEYSIELNIVNIVNLKEFYEEIPKLVFYPTDFFVIDYELFSYFNGIDVAKKIKKVHPEAIIGLLTAFPNQAIAAINSGIEPVAYVLKEVNSDAMMTNLRHLAQRIMLALQTLIEEQHNLIISIGSKKKLLTCKTICYFSTIKMERNKVFVETIEERLIATSSWKEIRQSLAEIKHFVAFKSYIFNLNMISQYSRVEKMIHFKNGTTLYLGTKILDKLIKEIERKQP
jgi:two-component system response regulator AgrA